MYKRNFVLTILILSILYFFNSCQMSKSYGNYIIVNDTSINTTGQKIFNTNCSSCHNFKQDGIGPQLSGVAAFASEKWIVQFIKNSKHLISSNDERAIKVLNKYKKAEMPAFEAFSNDELHALYVYIKSQEKTETAIGNNNEKGLSNPIKDSIAVSNLLVNIEPFIQIPPSANKPPLARITKLSFQPISGNLFINDLQGKLYKIKNGKPFIYLDIQKLKNKFSNNPGLGSGLGSFAFHPSFQSNGLFYTVHSELIGSGIADFSFADSISVDLQWVLTEWKTNKINEDIFSGTNRELLRINFVKVNHGVQEITFNPLSKIGSKDYGMLYMGIGDGGSVEQGYKFLTHSKEKIWGTVLRINPMGKNSRNGKYGIPADNPFVNSNNKYVVKEIYAYGFRNPHRITWIKSGDMLVSNIGQGNIESINLIKPGNDYGWPIREGSFLSADIKNNISTIFPLPSNDSIYKITYPVVEFDHDEGKAISGGVEYWGNDIPVLKGKFLFGDIPSGRLFYTNIADIKQGKQATIKEWNISINHLPKTLKEVCGSNRVDLHFGRDINGDLYILTKADGKVYKITSAIIKSSIDKK